MSARRNLGSTALTTLAVAVVSLMSAILVVQPSGSEAVLTPAAESRLSAGWLTLSTGAVDEVGLDGDRNPLTPPEQRQLLKEGPGCALVSSPSESLLAFTGTSPSTGTRDVASFASNSIGVAEKKTGTSCSQVGLPGEQLVLALNTTNVRGPLGPYRAAAAVLDVELKQSAQILATLKLGGQVVAYQELRSGTAIKSPEPSGVPPAMPAQVSLCNNPADSGPDAGPLDNCRWAISKPAPQGDDGVDFDSITLLPLRGSFSLEGGGDGAVAYSTRLDTGASDAPPPTDPPFPLPGRASYFDLVSSADGTLECNAATVTRDAEGTAPEVTVRRLDNLTGACVAVPYTLTNEPSAARFLKPLDGQDAQFVSDMVWTVPTSSTTTSLPPTKVDFETPTAGTEVTLGWCPDPLYAGTLTLGGVIVPKLVGIASPQTQTDMDTGAGGAPGIQFTCVGVQSAQVQAGEGGDPDTVQVVEQIYDFGDIKLLR